MLPDKYDLILVRKTGPVENMSIRTWFILITLTILFLFLGGLFLGGYLLAQQQERIIALERKARRLATRAAQAESALHALKTQAVLQRQSAAPKPAPAAPSAPPRDQPKETEVKPAPPKVETPSPPQSPPAPAAPKPAPRNSPPPQASLQKKPEPTLPPEPAQSDTVALRNFRHRYRAGKLRVVFDLVNKQTPRNPATGYVVVVARGERVNKPWLEAWPPMRLTPLGRPESHRRGARFTASRYRRIRASFLKVDKKFSRVDIYIYSLEGEIQLVQKEPLGESAEE